MHRDRNPPTPVAGKELRYASSTREVNKTQNLMAERIAQHCLQTLKILALIELQVLTAIATFNTFHADVKQGQDEHKLNGNLQPGWRGEQTR
jgi:hypothetical protein